jgi:hypothetical protein
MTQTKFRFIEEFASIRDNCLFCNTKLEFVFTNTFGISKPSIPLIKAKRKDNEFVFDLKYTSAFSNINTKVTVNTQTNKIHFNPAAQGAVAALESLSPHVELQCPNRKCKMNYYLSSGNFTVGVNYNDLGYEINPFRLEWECFNVSKFWVKNDYPHKTTDIFSTVDDYNHKPIIMPMLDFQVIDSDKIENKILTIVNFS